MKSGINCSIEKVTFLRIRMEAIKSTAIGSVVINILKSIEQECVKLLRIRPFIVLNSHSRTTAIGDVIRGIRYTDICFLAVKHLLDIFGLGSITAEKSVLTKQPDISGLNKRFSFESFINIEIIVLGIFLFSKQIGKL